MAIFKRFGPENGSAIPRALYFNMLHLSDIRPFYGQNERRKSAGGSEGSAIRY
jgi:hypothetical protein